MKRIIFILLSLFIAGTATAQTKARAIQKQFPSPLGVVNDFENILTPEQEKSLVHLILDYRKKSDNQICVVTIDSISPYADVLKFATDLSNEWGVGAKEKNNGLTIVLCARGRTDAIALGLGTEKYLTDIMCKEVREKFMVPEYKNANYYEGLKKGIEELIRIWGP